MPDQPPEVAHVEGMEHVGWYLPNHKQAKLWPASLTPNGMWPKPVIPLYAPTQSDDTST